uniref:Leucine-rich repeat-containing protein 14 n=1 Tax=Podarcis muralis TaxID=64176 RepID=A0A670I6R3_PODMU
MNSLVFLCSQKVVADFDSLQDALGFLPKELYPVLFKAAFMDKRTLSLQLLVNTWPFPVLSFQKLLRKCQHCERMVISGVVTYLIKLLENRRGSKRYVMVYVIRSTDFSPFPEYSMSFSPPSGFCFWFPLCSTRHSSSTPLTVFSKGGGAKLVLLQTLEFMKSTDTFLLRISGSLLATVVELPPYGRKNCPHTLMTLRDPSKAHLFMQACVGSVQNSHCSSDLQSPLESLELAFCYLLPNDLAYLSQSLHTPALKKLDLSGNNLSDCLLQPFQGLLMEAAPTLLHLDIMECRMMDTHLNVLLPAICRCSRLRYLGVFGNPISAKGLKNLLHKTVGLLDLKLVIYPYPVDCYGDDLPWPPTSSNLLNAREPFLVHVRIPGVRFWIFFFSPKHLFCNILVRA